MIEAEPSGDCRTLVIVDDERSILEAYRHYLNPEPEAQAYTSSRRRRAPSQSGEGERYRILLAETGEEAITLVKGELASGRRVAGGFFDMKMPGGIDGLETIRRLRELDSDILCTIVTAYHDRSIDEINRCFSPGHEDEWDYLNKPFTEGEIRQKARNLVASWVRRRREEAQVKDLERMIRHLSQIRIHDGRRLFDYLRFVLEHLATFTESPGAFLATVEGSLRFRVGVGELSTQEQADRVLAETGLDEAVARASEDASLTQLGDHCLIPVLCVKERRLFVLMNAGNRCGDRERLVRIFAQNAAAAIDNYELYQDVVEANAELEQRVRERTAELSHTNEELSRRSQELEETLMTLRVAEMQLLQQEKLAVAGQLAATVAHEINSPCAYALSNLEEIGAVLAEEKGDGEIVDTASLRERVSEAIDGVRRVTRIVRDLKGFGRPPDNDWSLVAIDDVIDHAMRILGNELRHRADVQLEVAAGVVVHGNADRLVQVTVNLLLNAVQAVEAAGGPRRDIAVLLRRDGQDAVLEVSDTGIGMDPDTVAKVFDPFFTTKQQQNGSGLGLSVTKSIIEQHAGEVSVTSALGQGTTFLLRLPLADPQAITEEPRESATQSLRPGERLSVLIVEDEPLLLRAYKRRLGNEFDLEVADHGAEALEKMLRANYDVIVCDLMMPGMSGPELFHSVVEARPGFERRFIFVTGGAFGADATRFVAAATVPILDKPVDMAALSRAIKQSARATRDDNRPIVASS